MEGTFAAVDTVVTSLAGAPEPDGHRSILDPRCIKPSIILLMPRSGTVLYSTLYYTFDQALYYTGRCIILLLARSGTVSYSEYDTRTLKMSG